MRVHNARMIEELLDRIQHSFLHPIPLALSPKRIRNALICAGSGETPPPAVNSKSADWMAKQLGAVA